MSVESSDGFAKKRGWPSAERGPVSLPEAKEYRFASFRLDPRDERLFCADRALPLKTKAFRVLCRLIAARGALVKKSELLGDVWADVTVGEAVLKVCVAEIRAALGDDSAKPRFIQTVHGRGYRFIAEVCESVPRAAEEPAMVGRSVELAALQSALDEVTRGESQMILINGEAGIGKTTLVESFLSTIGARRGCWVVHGRCSSHQGQREPYMPLLEGIGRIGRSTEGAVLLAAVAKFASTWAVHLRGLLSPEELARARVEAMGAALGRMLREMGDLLEALGEHKPVVLSVEDLHWSDHSTLELLEYISKRRSNMRVLLMATVRRLSGGEHESAPAALAAFCSAPGWRDLSLGPLGVSEVEELVAARFNAPVWSDEVARRLHEQTRGNPLFLDSVFNHLMRSQSAYLKCGRWLFREKHDTWHVPRDLRAFILQSLAAIPQEERRILEVASLIGREFDPAIVAAVVSTAPSHVFGALEGEGLGCFVHQVEDEPSRGSKPASLYRFVHPLFQQVLQDSVPLPERTGFHRSIAEQLRTARASAASLAHHYEQGGTALEAIENHIAAAESAHKQYAYHDAVEHLNRSLALLPQVPDPSQRAGFELRVILALGQALIHINGWAAPVVESTYRRAHALCEEVGGAPRFAALAGLYKFFLARGHFDTALDVARQCLLTARELGYRPLLMTAHSILGITLYFQGNLQAAIQELETARSLYDFEECQLFVQLFEDDPAVGGLAFLGRALWLSGERERALELGYEALSLARKLAHPHVIATGLALAVHLEAWGGNDAAVVELAQELSAIARTQCFALWAIIARFFTAWARCRAGELRAVDELRSAFADYHALGGIADRPVYAVLLAESYLRSDRIEECLEVIDTSFRTAPRSPVWDAKLRELRDTCCLQSGSAAGTR